MERAFLLAGEFAIDKGVSFGSGDVGVCPTSVLAIQTNGSLI
jgi:hypothetical protein